LASASSETAGARKVIGPYALLWFYRRRLRVHAVQELLAGLGVAIAVALVLATLIAAGSVSGTARQVVDTVIGPASLQLHARGQQGMPQHLLASVEELPAVAHAAPLLEQSATLSGPRDSRVSIDLAGADASLVLLDGLGHTLPRQTLQAGGIGLSARTASALEITRGSLGHQGGGAEAHVLLTLAGRTLRLPVSAVLGQEAFGALSHALVAVMPLQELQSVAGLPRRISRILVQPRPHRTAQARAQLSRLAAGRLDVAAADQDVGLLSQALRPSKQANAFFATVSAMLGVLLAFDALLLTVPERRRSIADLRLVGMRPSAIAQMLLFQALVLGVLATVVGLAAGYLLAVHVFAQSTRYLAEAFTLSGGTVVGVKPVLLAAASGMCAACLASVMPLLDLRRRRAIDLVYRDREPPEGLPPRIWRPIALACLALLGAAGTLFATSPSQALIACALLAATAMLLVPLALATVVALVRRFATRFERFAILPVALSSLRCTALRSLALAGTGAIALFGSVALGGARSDLTRGIESFARSYSADAGIWIGSPADNQAVVPFAAGDLQRRIAALPGVRSVQSFLGGFLQLDGRRVWVLARPKGYERHVLASQIEGGSLAGALARIGSGDFIAVSKQILQQEHSRIGGTITLPTPSGPARMRIVASTTNLAWSPGAIFIGSATYRRLWAASEPTALAVELARGARAQTAMQAIERLLAGRSSGLQAFTAHQREASIDALTSEGLGQLGEISTLLLIAAILALAAALTSAIWQRRTALAGFRLSGVRPRRLRLILLLESTVILAAGCITGALAGVCGQIVIDGYLTHVTGFPVARFSASLRPLEVLAIVAVATLTIASIPGWVASHVSPTVAFGE
jgi:putative ABC transport system permease protein